MVMQETCLSRHGIYSEGFLPERGSITPEERGSAGPEQADTHQQTDEARKENQPASWSWESCIYLRGLVLLPSLESENGKNSEKAEKKKGEHICVK